MRKLALSLTLLGAAFCAAPAYAQATRTWVSGVGDDANPCSRTAPCKTFAGAISKTAAGGEINCLDPGGFGGLTITKSITVSCEGLTGGVVVSGVNAFIVNAAATDVVVLKGLDFEGLGTGLNGIRVLSAAAVHIEDCIIRNFRGASPNGFGIQIAPSSALRFSISRTSLINNGTGATGGGIQIRPTANATSGVVDRVVVDRNVFGIAADSTGGTTGINVTVSQSVVANNSQTGILSATGAVAAGIMVSGSAVVNNVGTGLNATGTGGIVRVGSSVITGNGTATAGNTQSYGNNQINGNGVDTVPTLVSGGLH
jgi:Right handed beta helix region